ncbi:hypothetical protein E4U28_008201 [Claviceps purpurea]|nr:hypothetical protein E4U28_008201 [Claviceps purpurea]
MDIRQSADLENLSAADLEVLAMTLLYGLRNHPAGEMLHQLNGKRVSYLSWVVIFPNAVRCLKPLLAKQQLSIRWTIKIYGNRSRSSSSKIPESRYLCTNILFSRNEALEVNSSEHRKDVDNLMSEEQLGQIHVDIPQVLQRTPRYKDDKLTDGPRLRLRYTHGKHPWPQILVPGVLNCKPLADNTAETWHDFAICAGRFCSHKLPDGMGIRQARWYRIASQQIDINKEPVNFIDVMLGFLWMSESDLGFDPTIQQTNGERFIEIERNGRP